MKQLEEIFFSLKKKDFLNEIIINDGLSHYESLLILQLKFYDESFRSWNLKNNSEKEEINTTF